MNSISFRQSTLAAREMLLSSKSDSPSSRRVLHPDLTASLYFPVHPCKVINKEHTMTKTTSRCLFSMFRFYMSYAWKWTTTRGTTNANGARSECGNCQAAHAALTPNLLDDAFKESIKCVSEGLYAKCSPMKQAATRRILRMNTTTIEWLNSASEEERKKFLSTYSHPSFYYLRNGLFSSTSIGFMRNATFEGPTAGNRIDCHLESILRPLEDQLSEACAQEKTSPKEALRTLHAKYLECLVEIEERFNEIYPIIIELKSAEVDLRHFEFSLRQALLTDEFQPSSRSFIAYRAAVERFLALQENFSRLQGKGVPTSLHTRILTALKGYHPTYSLKSIIELGEYNLNFTQLLNTYLTNMSIYREKTSVTPPWDAFQEELQLRAQEVQYQKQVLNLGFEPIYSLCKMEFSTCNEKGEWSSPSRNTIQKKFLELLKESPHKPPSLKRKANEENIDPQKNPTKRMKPRQLFST